MNDPKRQARSLLRELGVQGAPVDVTEVARRLGVEVAARPVEDSVSGVLVVRGRRGAIGVNRNHHPHRQRFTVAHELGHFLLHRDAGSVFVDSTLTFYRDRRSADGVYLQEMEANTFAAELLMPEERVREELDRDEIDVHDEVALGKLAARFDVSRQALTIRLVRLGLIVG